MEREDELARAPRSASPAPRSLGGTPRSSFGMTGWKGHMAPSPYDRMSPSGSMMSPSTTGPPEADDYNRRSFSHAGTKRGRQPESNDRHYSAQERWLAQAGLGLDGHMSGGSGAFFGGRGMGSTPDPSVRGRDSGSRQTADPNQMNFGMPTARRMSALNHPSEHPVGPGSASAPISPVKQAAGPLPDHRSQNGTWSAQVSPRHASQARLPPVMDARIPGVALPARRVSGNAGRSGPMSTNNGFDARPPHTPPASGYGRYAPPPTAAYASNSGPRRAYSVGPAQNAGFVQGTVTPVDSGYVAYAGHPQHNGTSPLPSFQPFGAGALHQQNGNPSAMSPPSFISPTSLLSPETHSTRLDAYMYHMKGDGNGNGNGIGHVGAIGSRRVALDSDRGADDNEALDALASGLKEVALGLDAGDEAHADHSAPSGYHSHATANIPPPRKSSG